MSALPKGYPRRLTDEQIKERYVAVTTAIRAIEERVDKLEKWADGHAVKQNYSDASSFQKSAVDLHCAVAIIQKAIFPHAHERFGFSWMHGDTCEGCELDDYLERTKSPPPSAPREPK